MNKVEECKSALILALKDSRQLKRFECAKKALEGRKEERRAVNEFRLKVFQVQNSDHAVDMLDEMKSLFDEREKLYADPLIQEYLDAELDVCRLLQHVCMDIMSVEDLQLKSLDEGIII